MRYYMFFFYLTRDSVAPLRKKFVDAHPALAGDVSYGTSFQTTSSHQLFFANVTVAELRSRDIEAELLSVLRDLAENDGENIDLARIKSLLAAEELKYLSNVESKPHDMLLDVLHDESEMFLKKQILKMFSICFFRI